MFLINLLACHTTFIQLYCISRTLCVVEQEITGDVLLDLDVNLLKTEIGILAFGKRARIANAITELRRPPSVVYSDHTPAQSQSTSQPPTYGYSHSHSQSFQSSGQVSLHSPMYPVGFSPTGPPSTGYGMVMSPIAMTPESPTRPGDTVDSHQRRVSDPVSSASLSVNVTDTDDGTNGIKGAMERSAMLGLGLGVPSAVNGQRYRPAQLMLSPSDSNLGSKTRAVAGDIPQEADEERAFMSEVCCSDLIGYTVLQYAHRMTRHRPSISAVVCSDAPLSPDHPRNATRW